MSQGDTRSLQEIRRETEQTRAALTTTVEELRGTVTDTAADIKNRLRPDAIKAEVSGYIKSRGEQLFQDLTDMARRNPMQAVAIGASVAYPVMRLARAIPLPVLMIGAGLFLTGSKTGRDLSRKASDLAEDLTDEARRQAQNLGGQVSQVASDAKGSATDVLNRTGEALTGFTDQLRRTASEATDAVRARMEAGSEAVENAASQTANAAASQTEATMDKMSQAASSSARVVQQTVSSASEFVRDTGARAAQSGQEFLDATRSRATRFGEQAVGTARETVQQNPLLVAGVGLLIGGLIASVLPKSDIEENLAGDASSAMKRKAREAATAGFDAAKGATGEILANVAQQAEAEGLTPDGLARGAQDVSQRIQRVAERAVTTAFDPDHQTDDIGGERQNG
jgi:ElaB/YqjD/DUF883 family membrane-anchored ribosome-binding protein